MEGGLLVANQHYCRWLKEFQFPEIFMQKHTTVARLL